MARSMLLSLLVRQHMALKERFKARYPHPWLVWEAGAWNVPETEIQNVAATQLPAPDLRDCLPPGDALCFELVPCSNSGRVLPLGRSSRNALIINDATVSREHLTLSSSADGQWQVEALAKAGMVKLDGLMLQPGHPRRLAAGSQLELGDVRLTFHEPEGFYARLSQLAASLVQQMAQARVG